MLDPKIFLMTSEINKSDYLYVCIYGLRINRSTFATIAFLN